MAMDHVPPSIDLHNFNALYDMATSPEAKAVLTLAITWAANHYAGVPGVYGVFFAVGKYGFDCFKREQATHSSAAAAKAKARR